ncbi:hypothetical protein [Gordoniibacillus kamchatkensis]|nr:hypothetical protein [Paenibacillus sp. VKM B-2647]
MPKPRVTLPNRPCMESIIELLRGRYWNGMICNLRRRAE